MPTIILPISKSGLRLMAGVFTLLLLTNAPAFAAAGRIQFVAGEAKILNDKQIERGAKKGEVVDQGDTIVTSSTGSVQVVLEDGGLLAVRPDTQLRIDAYVYSGKPDDKNNKSFFSLAKGAFRSITGVIGQTNKQAYRVSTPSATMGIRGTDHEPAVVLPLAPGELPETSLQAAAAGTYDRVNSGKTFIQNADGLLVVGPNQVGFAPAGGGAPVLLPKLPAFYSSVPKPAGAKKLAAASGDTAASSESTASTDTEAVATFAAENTTPNPSSSTLNTDTTVTTNPTINPPLSSKAGPAPLGSGLVGASINGNVVGTGAGSILLVSPSQEILLGTSKEVVRIFDPILTPSFEFLSNTATLIDRGSLKLSDGALVDWGRWQLGYLLFENGMPLSTVGDFHYIFSSDITPENLVRTPGALTGGLYNYAGGTQPTNLNGVAGQIIPSGTSLFVDFVGQMVTFNVETLIQGVPLSGTAMGSITAFTTPDMSITTAPGSPNLVRATGFFVGPTAAGAITSFDILSPMGTDGAIGTAVFARPTTLP